MKSVVDYHSLSLQSTANRCNHIAIYMDTFQASSTKTDRPEPAPQRPRPLLDERHHACPRERHPLPFQQLSQPFCRPCAGGQVSTVGAGPGAEAAPGVAGGVEGVEIDLEEAVEGFDGGAEAEGAGDLFEVTEVDADLGVIELGGLFGGAVGAAELGEPCVAAGAEDAGDLFDEQPGAEVVPGAGRERVDAVAGEAGEDIGVVGVGGDGA